MTVRWDGLIASKASGVKIMLGRQPIAEAGQRAKPPALLGEFARKENDR
jgi:hypothetical protein